MFLAGVVFLEAQDVDVAYKQHPRSRKRSRGRSRGLGIQQKGSRAVLRLQDVCLSDFFRGWGLARWDAKQRTENP